MKNLTEYDDLFIKHLIEQAGGNPYKCTANVQYAVEFNRLVPVLVIYQDNSKGWDTDDAVLFCERTEAVNFCNESMSIGDLFAMINYYEKESFQRDINDTEYESDVDYSDINADYDAIMAEELAWYNHARQMGCE